jgi:hypothetical protein
MLSSSFSLPAAAPFSARRRAICPPPRRLPVVAPSARRRAVCSLPRPPHAGPLPRPCARSTPRPPTQAPARLLAVPGPSAVPSALSARPLPAAVPAAPARSSRRRLAARHRRYKLCVFILFICVFICVFMILCMFICVFILFTMI